MSSSPQHPSRRCRRGPGRRARRGAALAVAGPVLGLALAAGPAQAAVAPPVLAATATQPSTPSGPSTATPAPSPSPSPSPGQRPSGTAPGAAAGVSARDDTGTGIVLPLLAATVVGLLLIGLLFASAVTRRQREDRRL